MSKQINVKFPHILHGCDYNPEQWKSYNGIWDEDMRLMKLAGVNVVSIGMFSWAELEPTEGIYDFSFLDAIMEKLAKNDIKVVLSTPSGARPTWMSHQHPEILRVRDDRGRNLHGGRHNHCYTSSYYREKSRAINEALANRYKEHPALLLWHISNEYGGECHCELCQEAFRNWLKERYSNDLGKLNEQYWSKFWSHTYTDWSQLESPSPIGEMGVHTLNLDWKRFVTHQTRDFYKNEITPLRELTPDVPITTNFMGVYEGIDYFKFKDDVDIVSWDNYPYWHSLEDVSVTASGTAFVYDVNRSIKGKPFMLMESTPSLTNWHETNKLKRPGVHILSSIQAIAHGSDTVQYFQWRKSRGSSEKFHGAVVDHCGHENTRVFKEVAELGEKLKKLGSVTGTATQSEVAVIYDWENGWAINDMQALGKKTKKYLETCQAHYSHFWRNGINVDVIDSEYDFSKYKLIVAPMLYMMKPGVIDKIEAFVKTGGTIVATYVTGCVNESDLCYLGGFPADKLKDVFGIWAEEIDSLYPDDSNSVSYKTGDYKAIELCELIHANQAEILAKYQADFYAGMPALTQNSYEKGNAYYIAFRDTGGFLSDFYSELISKLKLTKSLDTNLPYGVTSHSRYDEAHEYIFVQNYTDEKQRIKLPNNVFTDMLRDSQISGGVELDAFGVAILSKHKG